MRPETALYRHPQNAGKEDLRRIAPPQMKNSVQKFPPLILP